ncbi:MAG TPA: translation initiation factor IF-2 subunit alpha [Methanomassiliicoccales archaeon]|nr:translation initiation factor IF-2 subunit alpha [Methanomassiliicoccales archaeon]
MPKTSEFPEEGELVVCTVQNVKNFGAFVTLDEYGNKEGFVHVRDVATGWVKYIRDYIREGQKVVCKVLGVDASKGHIDLSLKTVNEHQRREKIQQWKNETKAEKLLEIVAERLGITIEECYSQFADDLIDKFGSLYAAFEQCAANENALDDNGFEGDWTSKFVAVAKENVTPPFVQISGIIELKCPTPDGVDCIKKALLSGVDEVEERVSVQYIGAPRYRVVLSAPDYKAAEEDIKAVTNKMIATVKEFGGEGNFHREQK